MRSATSRVLGAATALAALTLSACSPSADPVAAEASSAPTNCPVTVADAWVKAVDSGMTAAFAVLSNPSSEPVTITAARSPRTSAVELHEVVQADGESVMRPRVGGFAVPAGGSLTLESGGSHLMLMDVTAPIEAGDEVSFTLTCATGATVAFTAQAKTYDGAHEHYSGSEMSTASPTAS